MHSSTSSSERALRWRWAVVWSLALAIAATIVGAAEYRWRSRGYLPNIDDSAALWSIQRDRVDAARRIPLVLLGASHIEFGIDMKLLAQLLPRYRPVMLAQNGHYPLAALRDLAEDEKFAGVVVCDIDARGLSSYYRDAQQSYVDYYHRQWSPSWRVHRLLLSRWQRVAVVADPGFGAIAELKRLLVSPVWPWRGYVNHHHPDRSGDIDFSQVDRAGLARGFVDGLRDDLHTHPPPAVQSWLAGLEPIATWVAAIHQRGGQVVFVQTPTTGDLKAMENSAYPRPLYWDRLSRAVQAPAINSDDVPGLKSFRLPDGSHVDLHDKAAYTRALVDALIVRGLVER